MIDWSGLLDFIGFYLIPGLVTGCIYALGAIGVSLLFGILRFAHFAHGDVMTLGGYLALTVVWWLGWPVLAAIPLAAAATAVIVATRMARPEPTPVFRADNPFLFLIRDRSSGALLFLGRVQNPNG